MLTPAALTRRSVLLGGAGAAAAAMAGCGASSHAAQSRPRVPTVAVSWDGGWQTVHSTALPILQEHGMVATVYVTTWFVSRRANPLVPQPALTWDQVEDLAGAGWEISNHTRTHPRLSDVSATRLEHVVLGAKQDLVDRGFAAPGFAYPFSHEDPRAAAVVAANHWYARGGHQHGDSIPPIHDPGLLYLIPISNMANLTAAQLIEQTKTRCLDGGHDLAWLAHIVGPPVKNLAVPEDALRGYAAWLAEQRAAGRLQLGTVDQLVRRNVLA
jgi:peptidoglycan/xylan/chitin deacetylase (PgdA/CDA1 family)